jgi:uncharacterized membrane protein
MDCKIFRHCRQWVSRAQRHRNQGSAVCCTCVVIVLAWASSSRFLQFTEALAAIGAKFKDTNHREYVREIYSPSTIPATHETRLTEHG